MKFYIAGRGSTAGIVRMRTLKKKLEALGHVCTLDWGLSLEEHSARGQTDADLSLAERQHYARIGLAAIADADVYVYQEPDEKSEGSASETMHAIDLDKRTLVVCGPKGPRCMFAALATAFVRSDDEALIALQVLAKEIDPACTCTTINSSYEGNPEGHDVACKRWGTRLPNTSLSTIG